MIEESVNTDLSITPFALHSAFLALYPRLSFTTPSIPHHYTRGPLHYTPSLVTFHSLVPSSSCSSLHCSLLSIFTALSPLLNGRSPFSVCSFTLLLAPFVVLPRSSPAPLYTFTPHPVCTTPRLSLPPKQLPAASHHSRLSPPAFEASVVTSSFSSIFLAVSLPFA